METQKSMLYEAALRGSVPTLLELLQQDPLNLDRVVMNCVYESPLHVAASLGHVDFVKEIMRQKPEHDWRHSSLLHIASEKGYVEMVKVLLQVNPAMCFARDMDGSNPLHVAAMKGRNDVLEELVRTRPLAASATTIWGETILHLCVKHNQLEALKFLLENMHDNPQLQNAKDDYGMTILHLAVADKQIEVIKFLTTTTTTAINVNALNANGFTALDILAQSKRDIKDWEIGELLRRAGAYSAKDIQELGSTPQSNSLSSCENNQEQGKDLESSKEDDWLEKMRNTLMVVASLIATMAFQAGINPPRSPWQDASSQDTTKSESQTARGSHHETRRSTCFLFCNTIGFLSSLSIVLLLISGLPLKRRLFIWILMGTMWVAITAMAMTFLTSIDILLDGVSLLPFAAHSLIYIWFSIGGILFVGHIIRLTVKMIKHFRKSIRRPSRIQAQDDRDYKSPMA